MKGDFAGGFGARIDAGKRVIPIRKEVACYTVLACNLHQFIPICRYV
jgi:hypothetical protein